MLVYALLLGLRFEWLRVDGITNPGQSKAIERSAGFEWLAKAQKFKYSKPLNEQPVHNWQQSQQVSRAHAIMTHLKTTA